MASRINPPTSESTPNRLTFERVLALRWKICDIGSSGVLPRVPERPAFVDSGWNDRAQQPGAVVRCRCTIDHEHAASTQTWTLGAKMATRGTANDGYTISRPSPDLYHSCEERIKRPRLASP